MKRFNKINDDLCLSVDAIAAAIGTPFESALNTIWTGLKRNRIDNNSYYQHHKDHIDSRKKWIVYHSLPETTRQRVDNHYQDINAAYHSEQLLAKALERVQPDDFGYFLSLDLKFITSTRAEQLTEGCGWMRLLDSDWWECCYDKRTDFIQWSAKILSQRKLYGLRVKTMRSLYRKLDAWKSEGRDGLITNKSGNKNSKKTTVIGVKRLIDLYGSPLKPSYVDVAKVYNRESKVYGWGALSVERIRQILNEPRHVEIWSFPRHGNEAARNLLERTLHRRRASHADALWTLDGTTVQLLYMNDNGKVVSELYIIAVTDAYSRAVIGYAIGVTETATLVQAALRDAARKTGMLPYQLQYDNSSANKSKEAEQLMEKMARASFPTAPYNGKSKIIEALFGHLEQSNMRYMPNFKGGNITAKSLNTRANPDHLMRLKKEKAYPTLEEALAQVELIVETHNHTPEKRYKKTPIERYHDPHDKRRKMDYLMQVDLFWVERRRPCRYTKDGLKMEVDGKPYYYEVERERGLEDKEFRRNHLGDSFTIMYDPDDLEYINLYQDENWIATAQQAYNFPMAKSDSLPDEGQLIHEALEDRRGYINQSRQKANIIREELADAGMPILNHQLVHKDAYNRMEQKQLDDLLERSGQLIEQPAKSRKRYNLYDIEEADGRLLED